MKIIDGKGRVFGLINILDLLVFVLIIGAFFSVFQKVVSGGTGFLGTDDTFYVTLRIERVRDYTVSAVEIGDIFYEQYAQVLGEVVKKDTQTPYSIITKFDGTADYIPMDDRYDLYLTLKVTGKKNQNGYYIGGNNHFSIGKDVRLHSNMIITFGTVTAISDVL